MRELVILCALISLSLCQIDNVISLSPIGPDSQTQGPLISAGPSQSVLRNRTYHSRSQRFHALIDPCQALVDAYNAIESGSTTGAASLYFNPDDPYLKLLSQDPLVADVDVAAARAAVSLGSALGCKLIGAPSVDTPAHQPYVDTTNTQPTQEGIVLGIYTSNLAKGDIPPPCGSSSVLRSDSVPPRISLSCALAWIEAGESDGIEKDTAKQERDIVIELHSRVNHLTCVAAWLNSHQALDMSRCRLPSCKDISEAFLSLCPAPLDQQRFLSSIQAAADKHGIRELRGWTTVVLLLVIVIQWVTGLPLGVAGTAVRLITTFIPLFRVQLTTPLLAFEILLVLGQTDTIIRRMVFMFLDIISMAIHLPNFGFNRVFSGLKSLYLMARKAMGSHYWILNVSLIIIGACLVTYLCYITVRVIRLISTGLHSVISHIPGLSRFFRQKAPKSEKSKSKRGLWRRKKEQDPEPTPELARSEDEPVADLIQTQ